MNAKSLNLFVGWGGPPKVLMFKTKHAKKLRWTTKVHRSRKCALEQALQGWEVHGSRTWPRTLSPGGPVQED